MYPKTEIFTINYYLRDFNNYRRASEHALIDFKFTEILILAVRNYLHNKSMWILERNFVGDKAKNFRNTWSVFQIFLTRYPAKFVEKLCASVMKTGS